MPNYTFSTLNDRDFEHLTQDLLQKELNLTFEGFKSGKDQGIDLRYARSKQTIIIQCKHYYKSGFYELLKSLKGDKGEFSKVKILKPTRYILVTSVELSPKNKDRIFQESNGLIKNSADIIGYEDLNNFLGKYPEIEKKHYKLWLSSTNILEKIFHDQVYQTFNNSIIESSRNKIIEIQKILPKLVKTEQYSETYKKLVENKIIFITGEAGCGKSTISEMLFIDLIQQGYQGWFSSELSEFKSILNTAENKDKKEIFFWDDIFGHTYFETERGFDTGIIQFIKSIKNSKNKYLIINSRTSILNSAKIESEKIKREEAFDINQYELEIKNYSNEEKALILYNHCILNLEYSYFNEIKKDEFYFQIIRHQNFSPRLIEFITDQEKFSIIDIKKEDYSKWILKNFNNPEQVWSGYFNNLSAWTKDYLKICYTFIEKRQTLIDECFDNLLLSRKYKNTDLTRKSVEELTRSFLNISQKDGENLYSFFNPSIEDFLTAYFNRNPSELKQVLDCAIYLEQFQILDNSHLPLYKQKNLKLESSEDLKKFCLQFIKQNKNNLKSHKQSKGLALYKIVSKLPVDDKYLLESIKGLLPDIVSSNESQIRSILDAITNESKNFKDYFEEDEVGILAYNYIINQTDFDSLKSAINYVKDWLLKYFYPSYNFFEEYKSKLEYFFDEFCKNYEYTDYYFTDLKRITEDGKCIDDSKYTEIEANIDQAEYEDEISQIVSEIKEITSLMNIDCYVGKNQISDWYSYDTVNDLKKPSERLDDDDREWSNASNNSDESIRSLFL